MRSGWTQAILAVAVVSMGLACDGPTKGDQRITQNQELRDKVEGQARLLVEKDEQLASQAKRIQELQGLSEQRRLDALVHVDKIEIERLSGGYDDDHDGVDEGVVVYVRLLDSEGDTIKAAGGVRVRVLDLAKPEGSQLTGEAVLDAAALRPMWYGHFLTSHYTVKVPWANGAKQSEHKSLTVHVAFTDLLSGRVFEAQRVVEVH